MKNWKNLSKRGLSLLVCLMMCLSMLPGVAYADEVDADVHDHAHDSEVVVLADEGETMPCTHPSTHKDVVGHGLLGTTFTRQICDECGAWYWDYYLFDIRIGLFHRVSDWFGKGVVPVPPTEENCTHPQELRVYRDNNDGATHRVVCGVEGCSTLIDASVPHAYTLENATKCVCGAVLVVPGCDHTNTSLVATDGTHHNVVCDDCDEIITANVACSVTWPSTTYCVDTTVTKNCECGNTLSHEYKGAGHTYTAAWAWAEDGKTATLTLTCGRDATHTHTEANVTATADGTPSCGEDVEITYTVSVVYEGKTYTDNTTRTVIATGEHSYESGKYDKDADKHYAACDNCTHKEPGEAHTFEDSICTVCGYGCEHSWSNWSPAADSKCSGMVDQSKSCELCGKTESQSVPATGNHTPGEAVEENVVAATCTKAGSYDEVVYCSECNKKLSRETKTIEAKGHDYDEGVWVFTTTALTGRTTKYTATGTISCKNCDDSYTVESTSVSSVTIKGTLSCESDANVSSAKVTYTDKDGSEVTLTGVTGVAKAPGHRWDYSKWEKSTWTSMSHCRKCLNTYTSNMKCNKEYDAQKHDLVYTVQTPATCETQGMWGNICSVCNHKYSGGYIDPTGHDYELAQFNWNEDETAATATFICANDKSHVEIVEAVMTSVTDEANCTVEGKTVYTATASIENKAGDVVTEVATKTHIIPTNDVHDYDEDGICTRCGHVNPADHTHVADMTKVFKHEDATCTCWALDMYQCKYCDEIALTRQVGRPLGHDYEGVVTEEATCTEAGLMTYTCKREGCTEATPDHSYTKEIPATGHTEVIDEAVAPGCETEGKAAGKHCSVCGEVLAAQTVIPATGHTVAIDEAVAPTCTETGLTEGFHCSVCDEVLAAQETVPATGHTEEVIPAVAATCEETGLTAGVRCSVCEEILVAQTETPATGHDWSGWFIDVEPTLDEEGHAYRVCRNDAEHREEAVLPQLPDPNETNPDPDPENPNPWTLDENASYAPTCTEDGRNVYTSVYGTVIVVIPATGHAWGEWIIDLDPTVETEGHAYRICGNNAAHVDEAVLPQLPDPGETNPDPDPENPNPWTLDEDASYAPTCTEDGANVYTSVYGTVTVVIPALGHIWDDGVVTQMPTPTVDGIRTYTCERCGETRNEAIPYASTNPTLPAPDPDEDGEGGGAGTGTVTIDEEETPLADLPFEDVLPTDWFYDAVMYVYSRGLMNGVSDTSFDPYGTLNRAMVVTILYRLEGEPETELSSFKDVEEGKWYTNAIGWGAANEIVEGYDEDRFGPLDPVTREQLAAILYRYAQYKGYDVTAAADLSTYTDADSIHEYALEAMAWAVELGAPTAVTETTLEPRVNATRAQVAEAFMNFCEKYVPLATEGEEA